jgi:predicted amidophosphoribosyltransferase
MLCPNCETENPANAEYCNVCGNNLLNNNIKEKRQKEKKNLVIWIIIPLILCMGFLFHQYLTAIIAAGLVIFAMKR